VLPGPCASFCHLEPIYILMSFIRLKPTINIPHRNISTYAINTYSVGHHTTRSLASRKVTKAPSPELPPAIGFAALCSLSRPLYLKNFMSYQPKKPWWCSGQHTRPGILSPYSLYLSSYSLSRGSGGRWFESSPRYSLFLFW
jgi:hypothetical protein